MYGFCPGSDVSPARRAPPVWARSSAFAILAALILEEYDFTDIHILVGGFDVWRERRPPPETKR
jgi:hypothetical protein